MADYIVAICSKCSESWYRTNRPLEPTDKLEVDLFVPLQDIAPQPAAGATALECPVCGDILRPVLESKLKQKPNQNTPVPSPLPQAGGTSQPRIELLFAADDGENILQVAPTSGGVLVLTTKKIFKVHS